MTVEAHAEGLRSTSPPGQGSPNFVCKSRYGIAPRLGDYVFMSGRTDISGFSQTKKRLDAVSGVANWRYHDLRRTAGTNMARLGVPVSTISRILNHKEGGVTAIYNRYSYFDEKQKALNLWAIDYEASSKVNRQT